MDTHVLTIAKAEPTHTEEIRDVSIHITGAPPSWSYGSPEFFEESNEFYHREANNLARALKAALPCGTFDRLIVALLEMQASHLRVRR